jgi:exo-beta-1,3-glucanase (GH17 family)
MCDAIGFSRRRGWSRAGLLLGASFLFPACGGSGGTPPPPPPAVNAPPTVSRVVPAEEQVVELGVPGVVQVQFVAADPDDVAAVDIYADLDGDPETLADRVWIAQGVAEMDGAAQTVEWDVGLVPAGTYRLFGEVHDATHDLVRSVESLYATVRYLVHGLNFGPYFGLQSPDLGTMVTETQIRDRLRIFARHAKWARTFGCDMGLERVGRIAHELGLKCAVGIWLSSDLDANAQQVANAIAVVQAGEVDLVVAGSEVLHRGDLTPEELIAYIEQVRDAIAGSGVPVATADTFDQLLANPAVIDACDVVMPNYYPYWNGISIDYAVAAVHGWHQQVVAAAEGKPVIVSESGWPSGGDSVGSAVPSPTNAAEYFRQFVSWARATAVDYFYFEATDEPWKAANEGPQGARFGVWTEDGVLKPGMQRVFDGDFSADTWTSPSIPGGPGTPTLEFTSVPGLGSTDDLEGRAWHVDPDEYYVAVYIRVGGGWWTKPTFASPRTAVSIDGSWVTDVTTGGSDASATEIRAFLLPDSYDPPAASGGANLPSGLDTNAVATAQARR